MGFNVLAEPVEKNGADIKEQRSGLERPEIDLSVCNRCGGCIEIAPEIFRFNETFGFLETADLDYYDPELVDEAIKNCPKKAITKDSEE